MALGAILGGIGAATSLIGGIAGSSSAAKQNRAAKKAHKKEKKAAKQAARDANRYAREKVRVDKENYEKRAQYDFDTAVKTWQYQTTLRALQEKTDAQKYLLNTQNSNKQLTYNEIAAQQGLTQEQMAMDDARTEYAFNRQETLVSQLKAEGAARLGQAGGSMNKRVQSSVAEIARDIAVMDASLTGQIQQSQLNMLEIGLGKYVADARVEAARMLRPENLPDIPAPVKPPSPTWMQPMNVQPGYSSPPVPQSTTAPLIAGIGSAFTQLGSIDWNLNKTAERTFKPQTTSLFGGGTLSRGTSIG